MKNGEQIFVFCAFAEMNSNYCNEQEAANAIAEVVENEGLDADDFVVVRGVEIELTLVKPNSTKISFDGKKVL